MRQEFSKPVKAAAFLRSAGHCECGCGLKIQGTPEYHHRLACALGGTNELENCQVLAPKCHKLITHGRGQDGNSAVKKSIRIAEKRAGIRPKSRGFRGWRRFDGSIVRADR